MCALPMRAAATLLRPPHAISTLPADDLSQLTQLLTRLIDADEAEPEYPPA
jgi:hypothetical protein